MSFRHTLTVRFGEIDRAGIVYFAQVFTYCHVTFEEMLTSALLEPLEHLFQTGEWAMPLVHAEADYRRPMRLGDVLTVDLTVERLSRRSITFAYTVRGEAEDDLRATARLVHAFVARPDFAPCPPPPVLLAGLERLGLTVDRPPVE